LDLLTWQAMPAFMVLALAFNLVLVSNTPSAFAFESVPSVAELRRRTDFQEAPIESFGLDGTRRVALTFDDGPGAGTEQILNTLKRYRVRATFFALGSAMKKHPDLALRIVREGHVLANHSYSHPMLSKDLYQNEPAQLLAELKDTHEELRKYVPNGASLYFRAPYMAWTPGNAIVANQDPELRPYVGPVCWDVGRSVTVLDGTLKDAADWECWTKRMNLSPLQCAVGYSNGIDEIGGGIVLMHDIHPKTAEMVELLVPRLLKAGYRFVTLDEVRELARYRLGSGATVFQPAVEPTASRPSGRCLMRPVEKPVNL
jgi:peptidoglycan/xylan/chitin deacetylase (PgdA/CDA1 family)